MKTNQSSAKATRSLGGFSFLLAIGLLLCLASSTANAVWTEETVFFDVPDTLEPNPIPTPSAQLSALQGYPIDANRLTLAGRIYLPDVNLHGSGPYPAVVIMHGSGGLWSNDVIANGLISQFEQWGELLVDLGYIVLFPDSYNPRGIDGNFGGRRPHYDPLVDDDLCSPNYERPKDVIAALSYLQSRSDVDTDNIGLMGFSHGAQTAMNAVVDVSVDLGQYQVSYVDLQEIVNSNPVAYQEVTILKDVDSPVRIGSDLPFPKVGAFFYGGGSHYRYHGQASSIATGRYMFDRRMKVLMFHGTEDSLLGVSNPNGPAPFTGNLFPIKQALSSSAQAALIGVDDPLQHHIIMDGVEHSFDLETIAAEIDWNTNNENADQKAKRLCREEVVKWLEACLKPAPDTTIAPDLAPGDVDLSTETNSRLNYQWIYSDNMIDWFNLGSDFDGTDGMDITSTTLGGNPTRFFALEYGAIVPPFDDPDNAGFFLDYGDFSY
ncbi:MAG: dienelactone hydrolase family protein [Verrucomicrobiota bacterium]